MISDDELAMLAATARQILTGSDPGALVAELTDAGIDPDVRTAGALLAVQGELLGRSTLLDAMLGGPDALPGSRVVLPLPGNRLPPARTSAAGVEVDGLILVPEGARYLVVHTSSGAVAVPADGLVLDTVTGLDAELGVARVRGPLPPGTTLPGPCWDALVDTATIALAHELTGVGQRALDIALGHVREREQFGNPLGVLQSVKHRLAGVHVDLEAARAALGALGPDPGEIDALAVKIAAGHAALGAVAAAQQLCGAMGFTAEHGLHRTVRRAYLLDALLGSAEDLEIELGALLAARATVPVPAARPGGIHA